jgi:hypothetical protein
LDIIPSGDLRDFWYILFQYPIVPIRRDTFNHNFKRFNWITFYKVRRLVYL